jgi:hypothetical protein
MGIRKHTQEQVIENLREFYKEYDYDYSKVKYINSNTKIIIICLIHGEFSIQPYKLFKSKVHLCSKCRKNQIGFRVKDTESFVKKANIIHNNKYNYSKTKYLNNSKDLIITCHKHGDFKITPDDHLTNQRGCPNCKKRHSLTQDEVLIRLNKIHKNKYEYVDFNYKTVYDYIKIKCPIHGEFEQKISLHLRGHGCPKCGKNSLKKDTKSFIERSNLIHKNKYDYSLTSYNNSQEKVIITCPIHGEFEQIARDHLHGNGCWNCSVEQRQKFSSYEEEIENFIKNTNPKVQILRNHNIGKKEIDVFLPEFNLGFEFNGNYWHSHLLKQRNYHKEKSDFFKKYNIRIFHIWEYQWVDFNKNKIIKSMILNKLKLTPNKIFARKCDIKEIDTKTYKYFCEENHIQGYSPSKIKLGLFYNGNLLSCMGFGNLRINLGNKNKNFNKYELIRYCTLLNYNIVGGASKLLKYFKIYYNPESIISYRDNDYSDGNLYKNLGFNDLGFTNISYIYYNPKNSQILNRFNFRKSELIKKGFNKNLTEFEITNNLGLYRLYNSGIYKYEMNFS